MDPAAICARCRPQPADGSYPAQTASRPVTASDQAPVEHSAGQGANEMQHERGCLAHDWLAIRFKHSG